MDRGLWSLSSSSERIKKKYTHIDCNFKPHISNHTILLIVANVAGSSNSWGKKLKENSHPECVILPKASLNSIQFSKMKGTLIKKNTVKKSCFELCLPMGHTREEY